MYTIKNKLYPAVTFGLHYIIIIFNYLSQLK